MQIITLLKDDPVPLKRADITKLAGYRDTYRIRVRELRIVYSVAWKERMLIIHYIGQEKRPRITTHIYNLVMFSIRND